MSNSDIEQEDKLGCLQQLDEIQEKLLNEQIRHSIIQKQYIEKLSEANKQESIQIKVSELLNKEILMNVQLCKEIQEVHKTKVQLERSQQYREEPEWQKKLAQLYLWELQQEQQFWQKLDQNEQRTYRLELQLQLLKQLSVKIKEQLLNCKKEYEQQKKIVEELKIQCEHHRQKFQL